MNDEIKLTFEAARDTTKQAITLATSVLVVMIAFAKNFVESTKGISLILALLAGISFLSSIAFGLYTLMALTGEISNSSEKTTNEGKNNIPSIWTGEIVDASAVQLGTFFFGLVFVVFAAIFNFVNLDFIQIVIIRYLIFLIPLFFQMLLPMLQWSSHQPLLSGGLYEEVI